MLQNSLSNNWWVTLLTVLFWADTQGKKDKNGAARNLALTFSREIPDIINQRVMPDGLNGYFGYNQMVADGFYENVRTAYWGLQQHQADMVESVQRSIKAAGSVDRYMANYR